MQFTEKMDFTSLHSADIRRLKIIRVGIVVPPALPIFQT
jgi:hypothetical protein